MSLCFSRGKEPEAHCEIESSSEKKSLCEKASFNMY